MIRPRFVVGVDVGGTYTDVFFLDEAAGRVSTAKVPSTAGPNGGDQSIGFIAGIRTQVADMAEIATVVHGTTVGTNALLERKVARTGVITTSGFRDVLEMRRRDRPQTWGLWGRFEPLVARDFRIEVDERTLADGSVHRKVSLPQVRKAAKQLLAQGAESLCIFFINSYANTANEQAALAAAVSLWPNAHVSCSSQILPEIREFERASTASLNAALQPVVGNYLERLEATLREQGFCGQILIVQSNGGVMSVETARRLPVRTALSGPAAGVIACAHIAREAGFDNVITGDMGGTSFDVSLIANGESALAAQTAIDFGMVVRTPMIEITTIGAGGGSIAKLDRSGLLQVGPESAGANPGPVCYGLGNRNGELGPTVTDANVVLGLINVERPLGNSGDTGSRSLARLDVDAAKAAIAKTIGAPLGLDVMAAAEAVIRVANAKMAGAIRLVSVERGHDPKRFAYMPFGGGGALHVCAMMREVGVATGIVPRYPGVTSALGCVIADMRHDFVQTLNRPLDALELAPFRRQLAAMLKDGKAVLKTASVRFERIEQLLELDMLYAGQTHTIGVPVVLEGIARLGRETIRNAFERQYQSTFGQLLNGIAIRVLNMRVSVIGKRRKFDLGLLAPGPQSSVVKSARGTRKVWLAGDWHEAHVYDRLMLPVGARIAGPALFEQPDATTFLEPDMSAEVDRLGNLIISAT
ncbi:MAG: hydantoinase/oxoprolinase family protein [Betaproteobacteria bacterium]|nr:hydantoinase/oxoprolinase family protein [Betaproteobacteria bacterium]